MSQGKSSWRPYDEGVPEGHPAQEQRDLKPRDTTLRGHGFKIVSRPRVGEATWERAGKVVTETEALEMCLREIKE